MSAPHGRRGVRLIATDLDGTLLRSDHRITESTFDVLARAADRGVRVVAATGRGLMTLPSFEPTHARNVVQTAVCSNGAIVVDLVSGKVLERIELGGTDVAKMFNEVRGALPGALFAWDSSDGFGWEPGFEPHGEILIDSYGGPGSVPFVPTADVSKTYVAHPELGYAELAAQVRHTISVRAEVSSAGLPFVVITAPNVTKANTLNRLCMQWKIDASEVVAFGDSWNDLEMIRWAGLGVAMGNANDDLKAAADAIAGSHDDEGVANFLVDLLGL